jgi:hypothetical protein
MKSSGSDWVRRCGSARTVALAIVFALLLAAFVRPAHAEGQNGQTVSLNDYIDRLKGLDSLAAECQKGRDADSCDAAKIGADIEVQWSAGGITNKREVRFGWLRLLFDKAKEKDQPAPQASNNVPPIPGATQAAHVATVDELLAQASDRLGKDEKQAAAIAGIPPRGINRDGERKSLDAILARKEYQSVTQTSVKDRLLEKLANWVNNFFARLAGNGARLPWAGLAFRVFWIGALCMGLAWFLVRMERRSRVRLSADPVPVPGAPSAREWQLWLADGRQMAAEGRWREAIHFVYWAAISRLESRRLWPADRARTPREYLVLLPEDDGRKPSLTTLTSSFERTWYGGRQAVSGDYQAALKLAADLGVE